MTSLVFDDEENNNIPNVEEYNLEPKIHKNQRVRITSNFGKLSKYKDPKTGTVIKIIDSNNIARGVSILYEIQMDEKLPGEDGKFLLGPDAFVSYTVPRPPRKDDEIIVIQSPLRYQYYTGILKELKEWTFDAKLSEANGKIVPLYP